MPLGLPGFLIRMSYCNSGLTTDPIVYKLIENIWIIRIYNLRSCVYF
jgi:hypothetical protein